MDTVMLFAIYMHIDVYMSSREYVSRVWGVLMYSSCINAINCEVGRGADSLWKEKGEQIVGKLCICYVCV